MIERIVIGNFKSLRKVDLSLGRMNLFIGTNASGKSNFLDALRVLQGIGNGFTIGEILDGKPRSATSEAWDGIRGGSSQACFAGADWRGEVTIEVHGALGAKRQRPWTFSITLSADHGRVASEYLRVGNGMVYDSTPVDNRWLDPDLRVRYVAAEGRGRKPHVKFESSRPVLGQFARSLYVAEKHAGQSGEVAVLLANAQRVDPSPTVLKQYSQAHHVRRIGDRGENFAALVKAICQDDKAKAAYLEWLRQLRPGEVDDVGTLSGAVGEPLFMLREGGREFPASVLSDGTLRFAAITSSFFQPDMPHIMTIEEIENGIHASRLRLLVELLRSRSGSGETQVFATTHSPTTLEWLHESEYRNTFLCSRDESTGESAIRPLSDIPHFTEVVKQTPLSDLLAEGWLEMAL